MTGCQRAMLANRLSYFFDFSGRCTHRRTLPYFSWLLLFFCSNDRSPPGPSTAIDTACSSSLLALENAFHAIRQGHCDAALVGGVNLLLKPNTSVQFMKLGMLSPEGTCKSFDSSGRRRRRKRRDSVWLCFHCVCSPTERCCFCPGNGYCRSEAAVVVLLTKRLLAKRVYATVINAGNNTDGYKEQGEEIF